MPFLHNWLVFCEVHFTLVQLNVVTHFLEKRGYELEEWELDAVLTEKKDAEQVLSKIWDTHIVALA